MATRRDIQYVLWEWFDAATGLDPSWVEQPAEDETASAIQPPAYPFATLQIISGLRRIGEDETKMPAGDAESEMALVVGRRAFTVQATVYGEDAGDYIQAATNYFQKPSVNGAISREQIDEVQIVTVADDVDYIVSLDGEPIVVRSGTPATALEIRDDMIDAINAAGFPLTAAAGGTDDVFIITTDPGVEVVVGVGDRIVFGDRQAAVDIVYMRDHGEINVGELIDATWEPRESMDFIFNTTSVVEDEPGVIRKVEITNQMTGETFIVEA